MDNCSSCGKILNVNHIMGMDFFEEHDEDQIYVICQKCKNFWDEEEKCNIKLGGKI